MAEEDLKQNFPNFTFCTFDYDWFLFFFFLAKDWFLVGWSIKWKEMIRTCCFTSFFFRRQYMLNSKYSIFIMCGLSTIQWSIGVYIMFRAYSFNVQREGEGSKSELGCKISLPLELPAKNAMVIKVVHHNKSSTFKSSRCSTNWGNLRLGDLKEKRKYGSEVSNRVEEGETTDGWWGEIGCPEYFWRSKHLPLGTTSKYYFWSMVRL